MITLIIVIVTSIISIIAFNNSEILYKYQLNPYQIYHRKQYFRVISHGFLHANWMHLIINMLVLYSFGGLVEQYFDYYLKGGMISYLVLYFGSMVFSSISTVRKHRDDHWYNAVGASGAVSAIVFSSIFFDPWNKIYFYGIIGLPGIILGAIYLIYSYYMGKQSRDNVNHDAHFYGAVFGFVFPILLNPSLFLNFLNKLIGN